MTARRHKNEQRDSDMPMCQSPTQMKSQEPGSQSPLIQSHLDIHFANPHNKNTQRRYANLVIHFSRQLCEYTSLPNTTQGTLQWAPIPLLANLEHPARLSIPASLHSTSCSLPNPAIYSRQETFLLSGLWFAHPASEATERGSLPVFLLHHRPCWVSPSTLHS